MSKKIEQTGSMNEEIDALKRTQETLTELVYALDRLVVILQQNQLVDRKRIAELERALGLVKGSEPR